MGIWGWVKFAWALWGLRSDAKALWDKLYAIYQLDKSLPAPSVSDFKGLVKDALAKAAPVVVASVAPVLQTADGKVIESGLSGDGSIK